MMEMRVEKKEQPKQERLTPAAQKG